MSLIVLTVTVTRLITVIKCDTETEHYAKLLSKDSFATIFLRSSNTCLEYRASRGPIGQMSQIHIPQQGEISLDHVFPL